MALVIRNVPTGSTLADERATSRKTDLADAIREGADYRPLTVGTYADGGGKRVFKPGGGATVALLQAVTNLIPHGMAAELAGWQIADVDEFTRIRRVPSPDETKWLALQTAFTCNVKIEIRLCPCWISRLKRASPRA